MLLHACNIVEHPELIAERLVRFTRRVRRDNVIAVWAKFQALSEGARIASRRLWPARRTVKRK